MTWNELQEWVLKTQFPFKQVDIYIEEDQPNSVDLIIEGVGPVFNAPFVGYTCKGKWTEGKLYSKLHIHLWEDECFQTYTWDDLVKWISTIANKDEEASVLCAWHCLKLKTLTPPKLYAYLEKKAAPTLDNISSAMEEDENYERSSVQ